MIIEEEQLIFWVKYTLIKKYKISQAIEESEGVVEMVINGITIERGYMFIVDHYDEVFPVTFIRARNENNLIILRVRYDNQGQIR